MKPFLLIAIVIALLADSHQLKLEQNKGISASIKPDENSNPYSRIDQIPLPAGFSRVKVEEGAFASWLRSLPLKKNKTVYLYNGLPKKNQHAQFAVIDMSVGNKDLQQCADAVMRLRAEYLYSQKRYKEIVFFDNNNTAYRLGAATDRTHFDVYLENVFARCGTASLEKQLKHLPALENIQPGDVLIQGGSPGHAMMVIDMAKNNKGEIMYLLAQSYMPAQDIHVVVNPSGRNGSPWYELDKGTIITPEWVFSEGHFRAW